MSDAKIAYYDGEGRAVFRASAVNKCSKALVASLLNYDAMYPPAIMQARFDAGHRHEAELLAAVSNQGFHLYGGQEEYDVPVGNSIIIRGHLDSLATHAEYGIALVEAKTAAPSSYDQWLAKRFQGSDLFRHYADQTSIYWDAVQPNLLVMVFGRKAPVLDGDGIPQECEDGTPVTTIDAIDISYFFERPANTTRLKARLAKVLNQAKTGELPDACDSKDYPCPFYPLHDEDVKTYATWSAEEELDALALAMERYVNAQRVKSEADKAQKAAKKDIDTLVEGRTEAQSNRWVVEYTSAPRVSWNEEAMVADGIDIGKYKVSTPGTRINVKELT